MIVHIHEQAVNFCKAQAIEKDFETVQQYVNYLIIKEREALKWEVKKKNYDQSGRFIGDYPEMSRELQKLEDLWNTKLDNKRFEEWENGPEDHRLYPENNKDCKP